MQLPRRNLPSSPSHTSSFPARRFWAIQSPLPAAQPLPLPHFPDLGSTPRLHANLYRGLTCPAEGRSAGSSAQFALRAPPKSFRRARWRRANVPAAGSGGGRSAALAGRSNLVDFAGRDVLLPSSSSQGGGKSGGHSLLRSWRPGTRPSGI